MSASYRSNIRIPSDHNTYVPLCYEDKENSFYSVNNLNLPTRVPKLDISRNRSLSRSKMSPSREYDSNDSSSTTSGNTLQRQYQHKMAPPCPKPQKLQASNGNVSNTNTLLHTYGLEVQRTRRSLSGYTFSAPLTEQFPITTNKISSSRNSSLEYSQFSSMNYPSVSSTDQPLVPTNLAQLSQRSSEAAAPFRRRQFEIRKQLEDNSSFEQSVQVSLKSLHNLGIRKQEVFKDCIKDLEELYLKYKTNNSISSFNILGDITQTTGNTTQQTREDSQKIKADKYNFEDFQDGKSYIEENPASDFSMEQYDTPAASQFKYL